MIQSTKRQTSRLIFHCFDLIIPNSWLEYRLDQKTFEFLNRIVMDMLAFKNTQVSPMKWMPFSNPPKNLAKSILRISIPRKVVRKTSEKQYVPSMIKITRFQCSTSQKFVFDFFGNAFLNVIFKVDLAVHPYDLLYIIFNYIKKI